MNNMSYAHPVIIPGAAPVVVPSAPVKAPASTEFNIETVLATIITTVNENFLADDGIFDLIDYTKAGVSRETIIGWWKGYKEHVSGHVESIKAAALAKLSPEERAILNI